MNQKHFDEEKTLQLENNLILNSTNEQASCEQLEGMLVETDEENENVNEEQVSDILETGSEQSIEFDKDLDMNLDVELDDDIDADLESNDTPMLEDSPENETPPPPIHDSEEDADPTNHEPLLELDISAPKKSFLDFAPYLLGVVAGTVAGSVTHWLLNSGNLPWTVVAVQFGIACFVMLVLYLILAFRDKRRREEIGDAVDAYDDNLIEVRTAAPELYDKLVHPDDYTDTQLAQAIDELAQSFPKTYNSLIDAQEVITGEDSELERAEEYAIPEIFAKNGNTEEDAPPSESNLEEAVSETPETEGNESEPHLSEAESETELEIESEYEMEAELQVGDADKDAQSESATSSEKVEQLMDPVYERVNESTAVLSDETIPSQPSSMESFTPLDELDFALYGIEDCSVEIEGLRCALLARGTLDGISSEILADPDGNFHLIMNGELIGTTSERDFLIEALKERPQHWNERTRQGQQLVSLLQSRPDASDYFSEIGKRLAAGEPSSRYLTLYQEAFENN